MGKKALITGATGMVGRQLLELLLLRDDIEQIVSIGRRSTGVENEKLEEVIHADFLDFSNIEDKMQNVDVCFYCLAVYQSQVSKEDYQTITCDYQKALTDALASKSPNASFVLFGAAGADPSEKSMASFSRIKGRAENLLTATVFPRKFVFRPGHIEPTGNRKPPGLVYKVTLPISSFLFKLFPGIGVTDRELAQGMIAAALDLDMDSAVYSNAQIRQLLPNANRN